VTPEFVQAAEVQAWPVASMIVAAGPSVETTLTPVNIRIAS
jgi:hypothetical protein